ncbi:MAG: hypothetical protein ACRDX8_00425 [Acidimicrobiales bacterium]
MSQSPGGTISGCYQVPAYPVGTYHLSLESFFFSAGISGTRPPPAPPVSLSLSPASGPPGTTVTVHGSFAGGKAPSGRMEVPDHLNVCWNGCPEGLVDQGLTVTHGPDGNFTTSFKVPATAWLEADGAHPLTSGTYQVGIQCLDVNAGGCDYDPSQGDAAFTLAAPPPKLCAAGEPCGHLTLVPPNPVPGQAVRLEGWAPVQVEIDNQPFAYSIQLSKGPAPSGSSITKVSGPKGSSFTYTLDPATLRIGSPPSWATLGTIHPVSIQTAGLASFASSPGESSRLAYCTSGGLELSNNGGKSFSAVPTAPAVAAIRKAGITPLAPGNGGAPPGCAEVVLGPSPSTTIYASFLVNPIGSTAPPVDQVALYSTNRGASWRPIPSPSGTAPEDFSAFGTVGSTVTAEFSTRSRSGAVPVPAVEETLNSGASWRSIAFSCPGAGPCLRLGAFQEGNCAMGQEPQSVLTSADTGRRWAQPASAPILFACGSPSLVAASSTEELLVSSDSAYPLQVSTNAGQTWSDIGLPPLPTANAAPPETVGGTGLTAPSSLGGGGAGTYLQILPDGALLFSASQPGQPWELLAPGATAWCHAPSASNGADASLLDGPPTVVGSTLWWTSTTFAKGANQTAHHLALASLSC